MNPNRLSKELRKLPGNIRSPHLPGGTLISAVLHRELMAWSDRGGASRIFGEIWSEHCWTVLNNGVPIFDDPDYDHDSAHVIRLDDNPRIAIQAGRNQLPNPDFLVLSNGGPDGLSIRAVDAKFAVDRLRRTQISPDSIQELVEMPGSLAKVEIEKVAGENAIDKLTYRSGLFLGPSSLLNDYFFRRLTEGDTPKIPAAELRLVSVESSALFSDIEEYPLLALLQSIDRLEADMSESALVLGMYYLRLASAARWFANQSQMPLLSLDPPEAVEVDEVLDMIEKRIDTGESAFGLIESWSVAAQRAIDRQKQIQDAARLPVRMSEIRKMADKYGRGEDRKVIRRSRGMLELEFMRRLIGVTGDIPAVPGRSLGSVIDEVVTTSRSLRDPMLHEAERVVEHVIAQEDGQIEGHRN